MLIQCLMIIQRQKAEKMRRSQEGREHHSLLDNKTYQIRLFNAADVLRFSQHKAADNDFMSANNKKTWTISNDFPSPLPDGPFL
jgi:hypothetical protein